MSETAAQVHGNRSISGVQCIWHQRAVLLVLTVRYESISREIGRKKLESERKKKKKQVGSDMRALPLRAAGKTARRKQVP